MPDEELIEHDIPDSPASRCASEARRSASAASRRFSSATSFAAILLTMALGNLSRSEAA
jgi:hypothetical protein